MRIGIFQRLVSTKVRRIPVWLLFEAATRSKVPKKVNRNPGVTKRGDKWQARAFHDRTEKTRTFSTAHLLFLKPMLS